MRNKDFIKRKRIFRLFSPYTTTIVIVIVSTFITIIATRSYPQEYKSLTLLECIDIALDKNPAINSARENLTKSGLQIKEAYSTILPKLSSNLSYTHQESDQPDIPAFSSPEDNYTFTVELMQPVYDRGKFFTYKDQAKLAIEAASFDLKSAVQGIVYEVISAYLDTLKAKEMLNIAEESKNRLSEHLRVTKRRYEVGHIAKNDVLRAEMELANAERDLIHAQKGLSLAHEFLQRLLMTEAEPFNTSPFKLNWIKERDIEKLVNSSYERRPDYLKVKKGERMAELGIKLTKQDFFPLVSLFGTYNRSDEDFFPEEDRTIIGGKIDIPIYEGGIRMVRLRQARHDLSIAQYQEIELRRQIRVDVIQALLHIEELEATLKAIDKQIEHAQENHRIVQLRYQEGEATNLDVIDANLTLVKAKTDLSTLNYDLIAAKFGLLKVTGDLTTERVREVTSTNP